MYSSTENDKFIVKQFKDFFKSNKDRQHFLKTVRKKRDFIEQQTGIRQLSNAQINNFLGNYLRMCMFYRDNKENERKMMADTYERKVAAMLENKKIPYVHENVLMEQNRRRQMEGQKALPTPDFLLVNPAKLQVGNKTFVVHWIECKSYYATTIPTIKKILGFEKTANKYLKYFGTGVMLFKHGYNKDLNVPDGVYYAQKI